MTTNERLSLSCVLHAIIWVSVYSVGALLIPVNAAASEKSVTTEQDALIGKELRQQLLDYLEDLNKWIMTLDVGSGFRKLQDGSAYSPTAICVNSYLVRVLMASYRIAGNKTYLEEALKWCDFMCDRQQDTVTSTGEKGGFWPDRCLHGNLYLADAGCAATALAIGYRLADDHRKARYLTAMEKYARFVTQGCLKDPQGRGRKVTTTWIIAQGEDKGALGVGYYGKEKALDVKPYTISTATCGIFFSELSAITSRPEYSEIVNGATKWLLKSRKGDGRLPLVVGGNEEAENRLPFCTHSYCGEAFVAVDTCLKDSELRLLFRKELKSTARWLVAKQNPEGYWGEHLSQDGVRSPLCMAFLAWYYNNVDPDTEVADAVRRYCQFLLDPANSQVHGVKKNALLTGFVGVAVAEVMVPGSSL